MAAGKSQDNTGFYRTYKELKHRSVNRSTVISSSFYRTYKELKLKSSIVPMIPYLVFIVPIRN